MECPEQTDAQSLKGDQQVLTARWGLRRLKNVAKRQRISVVVVKNVLELIVAVIFINLKID